MRTAILALVLVGLSAQAADAQLTLFYDVRPTTAQIDTPAAPYIYSASLCYYVPYVGQTYPLYDGGGRGDAQVVYLSPKLEDTTDYTGFGPPDGIEEHRSVSNPTFDWSKAEFYLYATYSGPTSHVVTSIGVDQEVPTAAFTSGTNFYLQSVTTTLENTALWDIAQVAGSDAATSLKMAKVPVSGDPPVFDCDAAIGPGDFVKIAKVVAEAEYRNGAVNVGTWGVKLSVNEFLCTHFTYPGDAGPMTVSFGYAAGVAETAGSGSVQGTISATDDMIITVVRQGDFDLDGLAASSIDDFAYYDIAADPSNCNPVETYLADFDADGLPATSIDDFDYYKVAKVP